MGVAPKHHVQRVVYCISVRYTYDGGSKYIHTARSAVDSFLELFDIALSTVALLGAYQKDGETQYRYQAYWYSTVRQRIWEETTKPVRGYLHT